jgi:hypothetical protein
MSKQSHRSTGTSQAAVSPISDAVRTEIPPLTKHRLIRLKARFLATIRGRDHLQATESRKEATR